jgi:hypothetical protein
MDTKGESNAVRVQVLDERRRAALHAIDTAKFSYVRFVA